MNTLLVLLLLKLVTLKKMDTYHCNTLDIIRGPKFMNLAIFDLVATFLFSVLIIWIKNLCKSSEPLIKENNSLRKRKFDLEQPNPHIHTLQKQVRLQKKSFNIKNVFKTFLCVMLIVIFIHYYFNIPTMLNYYLGLNTYDAVMATRHNC